MQVNNFIKYLDNSSLLASVSENEIAPLLEEFPYCQTGQLMQAVYLNSNNSILFEQQLKRAASYCTDRNKLFDHIHQEQAVAVEDEPIVVAEKSIETTAKTENKESGKKDIKTLDELEKDYLTAAVNSSILLESEQIISTEEEQPKTEPIEEIVEVNLFDAAKAHSFSDWLKHYNGEEVESKSNEERPKRLPKQAKLDLIDKFIQEDPKIQPKKTEFYSPTNMARLSVVDESDIVSETLALVYVDQGKYQEAIKAYEKLSLKNPEKRSYFASQIKILNKKLKQ